MTRIDLKDAYLSVHVHTKSSQKYLCFQWRNILCLPWLAIWAKYYLQGNYKAKKPIAAYLRESGI